MEPDAPWQINYSTVFLPFLYVSLIVGLFSRRNNPQPDPDPALEQFHRSVKAVEEGPPPGNEEVDASDAGLEQVRGWMTERFEAGDYAAVWERRIAFGYSLSGDAATTETWYWINAFAALAALRRGNRDHPFVATVAAFADEAYRNMTERPEPVEAANSEIQQRFFG